VCDSFSYCELEWINSSFHSRYLIAFLGLPREKVYSKNLKVYLMRIPVILEGLSYGSAHKSSRTILWEYA
jgi:hypothetical protein